MLQTTSWGTYLLWMFDLTLVYYIIILILYYKAEMKVLFKKGLPKFNFQWVTGIQRAKPSDSRLIKDELTKQNDLEYSFRNLSNDYLDSIQPLDSLPDDHQKGNVDNSMLFPSVHDLMHDVGQVLKTAIRKQYLKEELIMALQLVVSKYPMLENTTFKVSINNFVAVESRKSCSVFLNEDELERLWKKGN